MDSRSTLNAPYLAKNIHVLVVDTDAFNLNRMEALLKLSSYKVTLVEEASSALSMIDSKECNIDIVIAEVAMPEMDGFKLIQEIRLRREIPVILMGSNSQGDMAERALSLEASCFLKKPVRDSDLKDIWRHVFFKKLERYNETDLTESFSGLANDTPNPNHRDCQIIYTENAGDGRRTVWTPQLHRQFKAAVAELGERDAKPLDIQRLMNVPNLTRSQISSHLQKYRIKAKKAGAVIENPFVFESQPRRLTPNVGNEQPLGRPNLWNSIGGGNTIGINSSVVPVQNFGNALWYSQCLLSGMGIQNASTSTMPTKDFQNGLGEKLRDLQYLLPTHSFCWPERPGLFDFPTSLNCGDGINAYQPQPDFVMDQKSSQDLTQVQDCIMEETDSHEMQEDELLTPWQDLAPILKEDFLFLSQKGSSQNSKASTDIYMEPNSIGGLQVPYDMVGSEEPNKKSESMVGYLPSLEPNSMDGAYVLNTNPNSMEGSDTSLSMKPEEKGHCVLDDVLELLDQDERFNEWLKSAPYKC